MFKDQKHASAWLLVGPSTTTLAVLAIGFALTKDVENASFIPPLTVLWLGWTSAFVLTATRCWRSPPAWVAVFGLSLVALASGFGRGRVAFPSPPLSGPNDPNPGANYLPKVDRLDTWWMVLGVGLLILVGTTVGVTLVARHRGAAHRRVVVYFLSVGLGLMPILFALKDIAIDTSTIGRPIRNGGRLRRPSPIAQRQTPAETWAAASQAEADSVTAFLDLAGRLRRLDGPSTLIDRCLVAAAEEARHARICHRIARSYDQTALTAPAIPAARARPAPRPWSHPPRRVELARLAVESFVDGVIGESAGADDLALAARTSLAATTSVALRHMTIEERRHAQLGADIVRWALAEAPTVVAAALHATKNRMTKETRRSRTQTAAGIVDVSIARTNLQRQRLAGLDWLTELNFREPGRNLANRNSAGVPWGSSPAILVPRRPLLPLESAAVASPGVVSFIGVVGLGSNLAW